MPLVAYLLLPFLFIGLSRPTSAQDRPVYQTENLVVQKVADNVYQHISYLQTQSFGKVECNGMVVVNKKEALIFDTPSTPKATQELIQWVQDGLHCKIKAVVPTHFHDDCLGGLDEFHKQQVPSYASQRTIELTRANGLPVPQHGFERVQELKVGSQKVVVEYFGEGHTRDNVVAYFPTEKVLFGGCLIKEVGATKGYLGDANTNEWPATVTRLKQKYPAIKKVIPGHGKPGGTELLDYTISLFSTN
ncbi:subclass B1 metallo-beta-lactamase [Telluribacter sp. SYSU D00476]|uniref:subclass B1 metallo-beta-lactamase n=1 Tax=Telluribacter sp. SYSU D00476 TaxID=2811430 RepID=UPI001FF12D4D|nr:subclass B1 metallo-beta-lactamase [Telluribacter sp. SYSU D00476]